MRLVYGFCEGGPYHGMPGIFVSHEDGEKDERSLEERLNSSLTKMNIRYKTVTFDSISNGGFSEEECLRIEEFCKNEKWGILIRHTMLYPKSENLPSYLKYVSYRSFLIQDIKPRDLMIMFEDDVVQELRYRPTLSEGDFLIEPFANDYKKVFRILHVDYLQINNVVRFLAEVKNPWSVLHSRQIEVEV
jgi:hypothetical protein